MKIAIIRYLIGLILCIGISYLGIISVNNLINYNENPITTFELFMSIMGIYVIIIRPVGNYWADEVIKLININKDE